MGQKRGRIRQELSLGLGAPELGLPSQITTSSRAPCTRVSRAKSLLTGCTEPPLDTLHPPCSCATLPPVREPLMPPPAHVPQPKSEKVALVNPEEERKREQEERRRRQAEYVQQVAMKTRAKTRAGSREKAREERRGEEAEGGEREEDEAPVDALAEFEAKHDEDAARVAAIRHEMAKLLQGA